MQKVKFLQDFQGRETNEAFYSKDQVVELEGGIAERLIEDGRAVATSEDVATPKPFVEVDEMQHPDLEPEVKPRKRGKQ